MTSNCSDLDFSNVADSSTPAYLFLQFLQILFCILAFGSFIFISKKYKKVYIDPNIRCLMHFYAYSALSYCISFILIQFNHFQSYHLLSHLIFDGCDLLVPVYKCVWFRIILSWSSLVFQLFFISVSLEIALRQCFKWLNDSFWLPRFIGICVYSFSIFAIYQSLLNDLESDEYLANCASLETKQKSKLSLIFWVYLIFDVISLISYGILRIYINSKLSIQKTQFNVNKSMKRKELHRIYQLMFPNVFLHFLCYIYISLTSMSLFSNFQTFSNPQMQFLISNAVPFYLFMSPVVWGVVLHREQQKTGICQPKNAVKAYFEELEQQWK